MPAASSPSCASMDEFRSDEWYQIALTLQGDLGWGQLTSATSYFTRDIAYFQDNTDYEFYVSGLADPTLCAEDPTFWRLRLRLRLGPGRPRLAKRRLCRPRRPGVPAAGRDGEVDLARRPFLRAHGERVRFLQPHRELRRHAGVRLLANRVRRPAGHDRQLRLQHEARRGHRTDRRVRRGELFAERTLELHRWAALVRPYARSRGLHAATKRTRVVRPLRGKQGVDQRHHQETGGAVQHQRERDGIRAVLGRVPRRRPQRRGAGGRAAAGLRARFPRQLRARLQEPLGWRSVHLQPHRVQDEVGGLPGRGHRSGRGRSYTSSWSPISATPRSMA